MRHLSEAAREKAIAIAKAEGWARHHDLPVRDDEARLPVKNRA